MYELLKTCTKYNTSISSGSATQSDIAAGKTAYVNSTKITGTKAAANDFAVNEFSLVLCVVNTGVDDTEYMYRDSLTCPITFINGSQYKIQATELMGGGMLPIWEDRTKVGDIQVNGPYYGKVLAHPQDYTLVVEHRVKVTFYDNPALTGVYDAFFVKSTFIFLNSNYILNYSSGRIWVFTPDLSTNEELYWVTEVDDLTSMSGAINTILSGQVVTFSIRGVAKFSVQLITQTQSDTSTSI